MGILVGLMFSCEKLLLLIRYPLLVFVCWDEDLMPSKISDPAQYPATREPLSFRPISDDDRLQVSC